MDDAEYAKKYAEGADKSDILGKIKQASDARFQKDASGTYASSGVAHRSDNEHGMFAVELGKETYFTSYLTGRMSLMGLANEDDWFTGADVGMRLQTPTRLAPFVGVGASAGFASETVLADDDLEDNDDDGSVDEFGEEDSRFSGAFLAVYPEAGVHFWWTPEIRFSAHSRYFVTTEGRASDDWLTGVSVAIFKNPFSGQ